MSCEQWPVVWPCTAKPAGTSDELEAAAINGAQALLWARTGRRLGLCSGTEWYAPVGRTVCGSTMGIVGRWLATRDAHSDCAIHLAQQPVQYIDSVSLQGVPLSRDEWVLRDGMLLRVGSCWPASDGVDIGTVEVTYTWGLPIHDALWGLCALAMGEVAMELLHGACGGACKLPSRAISVTRQNVTIQMQAASDIDFGLLGMPLADSLINTVNPGHLTQRSQVFSPDMPPMTRRVDAVPGATNVGGVSTVTLPTGYEGEPFSIDFTFPDASYLAGGTGSVDAEIKPDPLPSTTVASFTPTIVGAKLTLTWATPTPGTFWFDLSVAGVTYIEKTRFEIKAQVSA